MHNEVEEECNRLVNKCMWVILSCKTKEQLSHAINYSNLVYKRIHEDVGLVNNMRFVSVIERTIGFAECRIHYDIN